MVWAPLPHLTFLVGYLWTQLFPRSTLPRLLATAFAPSAYLQLLFTHLLGQARLALMTDLAVLLFFLGPYSSLPPLLVYYTLQNPATIASASSHACLALPPSSVPLVPHSFVLRVPSAPSPPSTPCPVQRALLAVQWAPPAMPRVHPALRATTAPLEALH